MSHIQIRFADNTGFHLTEFPSYAFFAETWNGHKKRTPCKSLICRRFRGIPKHKVSLLYLFRTRVATPYFCINLIFNPLQAEHVAGLSKSI